MARFGRLPAIWQSFYSRNLYCDAAFRWQGTGLLYLLLLLAVTWLPTPARWARGLSEFADRSAPHLAQELPAIAIENGVMRADPPGRHVVHDPDEPGKVMLIVDDTIDEVDLPSADADLRGGDDAGDRRADAALVRALGPGLVPALADRVCDHADLPAVRHPGRRAEKAAAPGAVVA